MGIHTIQSFHRLYSVQLVEYTRNEADADEFYFYYSSKLI